MPRRTLDAKELELWRSVTRNVRRPRRKTDSPLGPVPDIPPESSIPVAVSPAPVKRTVSFSPIFDREVERRLLAGKTRPEARLDLHGMTEAEAHAALVAFISKCRSINLRLILVITGKGKSGEGILKQNLPRWVEAPGIRPFIAGIRTAFDRHGGEGATYLLLRRSRK